MRLALPGATRPRPTLQFFGDYELLEEIAHGGMGIVFRARHLQQNRLVALKMILSGHLATPTLIQRFRSEAEAASRLDHPGIVPIYEIGERDGQHYFAMKLVEGRNLAHEIARRRLSVAESVRLTAAVARAVHHAHERGILHRDLKPTNILLDAQRVPHVSDFGLAKILEDNISLTQSLAVLGTPTYMAPEQAMGHSKQITTAADIYSIGAILYELLTGRPPFRAETALATMRLVAEQEPKPPRSINAELDASLETVCLKCLQKEPSRRYASAAALADDLDRFGRGQPVEARPVSQSERFWRWCRRNPALAGSLAALGLVFFAGFAGVAWQWRRAEGHARQESDQRARIQTLATRLMVEKAEFLFGQDRAGEALAHLARVSRQFPTNRVVAERMLSALGQRNFCLPLAALRHTGEITTVHFSPDGRRVLTASRDHKARFWDSETGALLGELQHEGAIESARFSRDGRLVVTASRDKTAQIWHPVTGARLGPALAHGGAVTAAEFSPDGQIIVTASADRTARLWDSQRGLPLTPPLLHGSNVVSAQFSPAGDSVLTVARDKTVRIWDARTGRPLLAPITNQWQFDEAQFMPDGQRVLVAMAYLFDARTGRYLGTTFDQHLPRIYAAETSPDGRKMVTACADSTARLWDAQTGAPLLGPLLHDNWVYYAAFSPDGLNVLTCAKNSGVRVWDALTARPITEPLWHNSEVRYAEFSPSGLSIVTLPAKSVAWIWDLRHSLPLTPIFPHGEPVPVAHFSQDGQRVLTASWDHTAQVWDVRSGQPLLPPLLHRDWIPSARFSSDERFIVTASYDRTARIWDAQTGEVIATLPHEGSVAAAEFSPDGQRVVTASLDGTARIWNARTGEAMFSPLRHDAAVHAARFSPDGERVVTASSDRTARLWNARTGESLAAPLRHGNIVSNARFTRDGRRVVTVSHDRMARVWDARTGQLLAGPVRHEEEIQVHSPDLTEDGARVLTAARNTARVWDAFTGLSLGESITHMERVTSAHFDAQGQRVVTTSKDFTARVWDPQTGLPLTEALRHTNAVIDAEFSRDGRWLVTCSHERLGRVWEVPFHPDAAPAWLPDLAEAVGGQRIDAQNLAERVPLEELLQLRARLTSLSSSNSHAEWAKWFFARSAARTISPSSPITVLDYVEQRLRDHSLSSLRLAVRLSPTNGLAMARLAAEMVRWPAIRRDTNALAEALWYGGRSTNLSPASAEVWLAQARLQETVDGWAAAMAVLDQAQKHLPYESALWVARGLLRQKTNQWDEAARDFARAIELADTPSARAEALLRRSDLLAREGRPDEARLDFLRAKGIPARDFHTRPELIDLTAHYNAGLEEIWRGRGIGGGTALLSPGVQKLGGVEFDARGAVQLGAAPTGANSPRRVENIKLGLTCQRIHFLHATGRAPSASSAATIARYIVHFANGRQQEIPVVFGRDLRAAWSRDASRDSNDVPALAWRGATATAGGGQAGAGLTPALYRTSWSNPWPALRIEKVDFVCDTTESDVLLAAITME
jgi:WD40 repeat protein/tetratricopeptide (TPR) repeat protein